MSPFLGHTGRYQGGWMQVIWSLVLECGDVISRQQGCFFLENACWLLSCRERMTDKMLLLFAYGASILPEYAVRAQVWFPSQDGGGGGGGEQESRNPRARLRQCFTMHDFSSWYSLMEVLMEWLVYSKYALPTQYPTELYFPRIRREHTPPKQENKQ